MFRLSTEFSTIPYDGWVIYSIERPRREFLERIHGLNAIMRRQGWLWEGEKGWANLVSLPVNGSPGALAVGWGPLMAGRHMPNTMVRCNVSTAGLSPNEALALHRWVVTLPELDPVAELATKLDVEGTVCDVDSRLYLPGGRATNKQYEGESHYHGSRKGIQLRPYDKGRQVGGLPRQVCRVEMIEHFKNNRNPSHNSRRPRLAELLKGDLVDHNGLRRVLVVDLEVIGDMDLVKLAREKGLAEAIRIGPPPRTARG